MDKALRNSLRLAVTGCRRLLETEIGELLEGQFGIHHDGRVEDVAALGVLSPDDLAHRDRLLAHLRHIEAGGFSPMAAVAQLVREAAFTHLNRLCAYKMLEVRKLIRESVSRGPNSNGFKFYLADHPADDRLSSGGERDLAYRHFLEWLAGTLAPEMGVLFSPHDPANGVFPRQRALEGVLALLNDPGLAEVWQSDETIGWVYQYFTPKELRDEARKESAAPRNSYELAFRNQFYTPRYVVEFLVDNTLGRMWYEMRCGDTVLKEQCRSLVYRPGEVFLSPRERAPVDGSSNSNASDGREGPTNGAAEGTESRPIYVAHRPKKDPRHLAILDPAMGSGHFLLYCFDVLETIYAEAYDDPDLGPALQSDYSTVADLRRDLPRLILTHNLHGVDIDRRATQIAALALWLRAQRSFAEVGITRDTRPRLTRSNIVCAEPMPGERELLAEFIAALEPPLIVQLVHQVFEKMTLAGEAGSLLKIEDALRDDIWRVRRQARDEVERARDRRGNAMLFSQAEIDRASNRPHQGSLFDLSQLDVTDEGFWGDVESRVLAALADYAEHATDGQSYQRALFADDAARGFAFVDLCRRRFDIVLMNPPFGAASLPTKGYVERVYPRTKNDIYAAFVERGLGLLHPSGMLGAITSRTGFFLTYFQKWREELLLTQARPTVVADLGQGVLDTAMVETAAYCLEVAR